MIERLKEIRETVDGLLDEGALMETNHAVNQLDELIADLEEKEACITPVSGELHFYKYDESGKKIKCDIFDLENVLYHKEKISTNGRKWFAISGILIDKE